MIVAALSMAMLVPVAAAAVTPTPASIAKQFGCVKPKAGTVLYGGKKVTCTYRHESVNVEMYPTVAKQKAATKYVCSMGFHIVEAVNGRYDAVADQDSTTKAIAKRLHWKTTHCN